MTAREKFLKIQRGEIQVPLRCIHCKNASVLTDHKFHSDSVFAKKEWPGPDNRMVPTPYLICIMCGKTTKLTDAKKIRVKEIVAMCKEEDGGTGNSNAHARSPKRARRRR